MEFTLTPELQRFVDENVKNGRFKDSQEVVLVALTAYMHTDASMNALSDEEMGVIYPGFREKIEEGLADLRAGRVVDGEAFFDALEREDERPAKNNRKSA